MASVVIEENTAVTKPVDPVRRYVFLGWFVEGYKLAYDFKRNCCNWLSFRARWLLKMYTVTYELISETLGDYADKDAMIDAFLEDFYTYLGLTSDKVEFKHYAGKLKVMMVWHSVHKEIIWRT